MGLLDRIQKIQTPESVITVEGIRYRVKGLSGFDASSMNPDAERENKKRKHLGLKRLSLDYFYLEHCVCEAETGETLTAEQWAGVPRKHTAPIVVEVMNLNGLDDEDVQRDPKDLGATAT